LAELLTDHRIFENPRNINERPDMAADYDEDRPEIAEAAENNLRDIKVIDSPAAKVAVQDMEEFDFSDGAELPEDIVDGELNVNVVPQGSDEFVCPECFIIRHHSNGVMQDDGVQRCRDCVEEYA